ncbi:dTDP-4-amino-4,6-dideoxygalactose transaminase [Roseococcus sp. YIM B11640]|uniref:dTDP-4-amino-4,6-dideoxygalactose transaminase n=1 Tax=Roseococcus sp. YIM B11640 TaxID=3133973 RepID=UPI003C79BA83
MISFNQPTLAGPEFDYVAEALERMHLSGNGAFTKRCQRLLEQAFGAPRALLTHSATAALEMAAILADIGRGDEVIMPSYTFCSTANAVVLRGGVPVFVDIRPDTLNIDEKKIEAAITPRTRAIMVVHYAGVAAQMDVIMEIADRHSLLVIEDAAQAVHADFRGKPLGSFGALAALSFHETKNLMSGEGGALIVNDAAMAGRAEIIWEKGTNRAQFHRGEVARYTWVDLGSSFLPSELTAAFLCAQLEAGNDITARRLEIWRRYDAALLPLEAAGLLRRPRVPQECGHNAHIYFVLAPDAARRDAALKRLSEAGVNAVIHYVPLHSAPAGIRYGRMATDLPITDDVASRLIRLPLHSLLTPEAQQEVVAALAEALA